MQDLHYTQVFETPAPAKFTYKHWLSVLIAKLCLNSNLFSDGFLALDMPFLGNLEWIFGLDWLLGNPCEAVLRRYNDGGVIVALMRYVGQWLRH